jgi:hypothetical protein
VKIKKGLKEMNDTFRESAWKRTEPENERSGENLEKKRTSWVIGISLVAAGQFG